MKKRWICLLLVSVLSVIPLTSCGKNASSSNTAPEQTPAPEQKPAEDNKTDEVSNHMKITLDAGKTADSSSHPFTVNYSDSKSGKICVVDFSNDSHSYEMCVSGLTEEFTNDQINTLIGAFLSETPATIESDDFIDAEKFSVYMHGDVGNWVFTDDDFRKVDYDDWGDNGMCWAGSASDMLWNTGWAQLATQKNPDLAFKNVDDVFNYFCSNFPNGAGSDAYDAIDWFLDGGYAGLSPDKEPGNLPEYKTADYAKSVSISNGDSLESGVELIKAIKDGGTVGLAVDFSNDNYPLKENSDTTVSFDPEHDGYVEDRYDEIDDAAKTIKSAFYVYDDKGLITIVDKKDEDTYITSDGKEYDAFNVLTGDLYPTDDGSYALVDDDGYISYFVVHDPDELDSDNVETNIIIGNGAHAITVFGYVLDTDEAQPTDSVKALFIVDSDNDADYYNIPGDARGNELALRAARPNTMQMFRTSPVTTFGDDNDDDSKGITLNIEGYLKETYTAIAVMTGLKALPQ